MNDQQKRVAIFNKVWQACDTFRGVIDPAQYKDYILTMLFVKYLCDIHKSRTTEFEKNTRGMRFAYIGRSTESVLSSRILKSETVVEKWRTPSRPCSTTYTNGATGLISVN